jgi:hypothetical protein
MTLDGETRRGSYHPVFLLGANGMGEAHRADAKRL